MDFECRQVTRLLSERMDRKLTASERRQVKIHLSNCPGCRNCGNQFDFLRRAIRVWRTV